MTTENSHKLLIEHSPYCIHSIDLAGRLVAMNPAGLAMMGVKDESEIRGMPFLDAVRGVDRARVAALLRAALGGEASEFAFRASSGRHFLSTFVPVRGEQGGIISLMGLTQDITERVETEEALRRSEEKLQLALSAAEMGVWELDLRTDEVQWSERTCRIYGIPHGPTVCSVEDYLARIHPEDQHAVRRALEQASSTLGPFFTEHRVYRPDDGCLRWVQGVGRVCCDAEGQMTRMMGTVRDITERKEDQRRRQASLKLEQLGVLAGGIAHDFNNLLMGMLGSADLLKVELEADTSAAAIVDLIHASARRAADLCQQMLAYAGRSPQRQDVVELREVVEDISSLIARALPAGVTLRRELGRSLPPVVGDASQLSQVVLNLLTNAVEAVEQSGGGTITVRAGVERHSAQSLLAMQPSPALPPGEYVFFEVIDDGCGMSAETISRMFDPFFTTRARGHGLGLAATMGIVGGHKGGISVESAPDQGARIRVILPPSSQPPARPSPAPTVRMPAEGRTVLVVDDEALVRNFVRRALLLGGYTTVLAASGEAALERLQGVDVVLLDSSMPGMSGAEVLKAIQERRPGLPVVLSSGHMQNQATIHADAFLKKPYLIEDLLEILNRVLRDCC